MDLIEHDEEGRISFSMSGSPRDLATVMLSRLTVGKLHLDTTMTNPEDRRAVKFQQINLS